MMNLLKSLFGAGQNSDFKKAIAEGAVVIDVRSPGEFAGGHANGAINIPLDQLDSKMNTLKSYRKPIVLCCASGMRSGRAKVFLAGQGISDVYDAGSWRNLA